MYLAIATRPDISYAVNLASRYMEKPTKIQWNAVKRIFKYLNGTRSLGLRFETHQDAHLKAYSDADYAGEVQTRRSTTGCLMLWGSSVLAWTSQRQSVVALSTTDAEYMAACHVVKEVIRFKRLIKDLSGIQQFATTLYLDNQSAIELIKNPVFHKRTKHIDIRFHYIRERYADKEFQLEYVNTKEQTADIFTKPLTRLLFEQHRRRICFETSEN